MSLTEPATRELRYADVPLRGLEVRDGSQTGDGSLTITGYAAVTEQETTLYDGRMFQLNEVISRGAFGPVLSRTGLDVHLNIGHDNNFAMARTGVDGIGRLELTEDERGLRVFARVDPEISFVRDLSLQMKSGVVDQMSFAFTVADDEAMVRDADGVEVETRRILEIGDLYDVTVVARGAYPQTSAQIRSLMGALSRRGGFDPPGAQDPVAPAEPVGGIDVRATDVRLRRAKARARLSLIERTPG